MSSYEQLRSLLSETGGVVVGYSGGVDSSLVAVAAADALGDRAVCVLVDSCLVPRREVDEAVALANERGLNLVRLQVDALSIENVPDNAPDRCYHCKKAIFSQLVRIARERGLRVVMDGSNADDDGDYRPGSRALAELGVRSPLKEMGLTKDGVRAISREVGLPTWNRPSYACLASRIPYGTRLSREALGGIDAAEEILRGLGFRQFRVRHHGDLARIEVLPPDMDKLADLVTRERVVRELKSLGYSYVAMDLTGYRTGSMNEVLGVEQQGGPDVPRCRQV